ncbi:MAG: LOG family protein [Alphaproteobacteria bacterium]|nr:LOG family protein [Alphaproteobacteria bacterium]
MKHDRLEQPRTRKPSQQTSTENLPEDKVLERFRTENSKAGIRVFVAGGSRSGNDSQYTKEAYLLGQKIVKMNFKLDFGLSNSGIMGAVARGVMDSWNSKEQKEGAPIQGITTKEYYKLYPSDDELIAKMEVVVTRTLEERKRKLLNADYVVFAPGGVGTLDELAYDCVAMQDGLLPMKPFIIYNINGYFYHLLEFLKVLAHEGFAEPVPFIVVDDAEELEIAFRLLRRICYKCSDAMENYANARWLIYVLPYYIKQQNSCNKDIETCLAEAQRIEKEGTLEEKKLLASEIETAYLEREIEKMYARLAMAGRDTGAVSDKLDKLKKRHKEML